MKRAKKERKIIKERARAYLHLQSQLSASSSNKSAVTERDHTQTLKMINLSIASPSSVFLPSKVLSSTSKSSFNGLQIRFPFSFRVPPKAACTGGRNSSVVMMAKREEELKEIRAKTTEEINEEVVDLKGELLMLRLQKSARNEFKSSEFRRMRKRVLLFPY